MLLDQNAMAKGLPFLSVGAFAVSDDDDRLLYSTDDTGFRQYKLFVKDLKTGAVQGPLAERVTSVTWAADNRTVFYVTEHPVTKRPDTLWRLALGGQPVKVHEETDEQFSIGVGRTKDKKFVVLGSGSTDTWDRWLLPAATPGGELRPVLPREKGHKYDVEHRDGTLFIRTNKDAKNFRLVTAPLADPSPAGWKPFVEHRPDVLLEDVEVFKDFVVLQEKQAGLNRLRVHGFSDGRWREVAFPEPVYTAFASGTPEFDSKALRYSYQSLTTPPSVYDYDMATGTSVLLKREEVLGGFDPGRYVSERLWATARDGVEGADQHRLPEGLRPRRQGSAVALRLRLLRRRNVRHLRQPPPEPPRPRDPVRHRARPWRQRDGRGVARRRHADEEEEHVLRLHRLRRAPRRGEVDRPRPAADRRRQRRWPPDGRGRRTSAPTSSAPSTPRCRSRT